MIITTTFKSPNQRKNINEDIVLNESLIGMSYLVLGKRLVMIGDFHNDLSEYDSTLCDLKGNCYLINR